MLFINVLNSMPYPELQYSEEDISNKSYKKFPEEFVSEFYKSGKIKPGFVNLVFNEKEEIINAIWNEEEYQKYLESLPQSNNDKIDILTKENEVLKTQIKALSDNQTFLEDCLIEVGQVVYA